MPPETRVDRRSGVELIRIPAGELRMGSSEEDEDAQPVHVVRLASFWIGKYEVTREQYEVFARATERPLPAHWKHRLLSRKNSPVIGVTWQDAVDYCQWAGGRLPTEAEWEYAARGATTHAYPWGDDLPDATRAVHHRDVGFGGTLAVGTAKEGASPFGVMDMAGNVFEWCADWYSESYYAISPRENPKGPPAGEQRVVRGGSWISLPDACRATARAKFPPESRSTLIGFRLVQDAR